MSEQKPNQWHEHYWADAEEAVEALKAAEGAEAVKAAYEALENLALGEEREFMRATGSKWAMMALACYLADPAHTELLAQARGCTRRKALSEAVWYLKQIKMANARESTRYWPSRPPSPDGYMKMLIGIYRNPEYWNPDDPESKRLCLNMANELEKEYRSRGF